MKGKQTMDKDNLYVIFDMDGVIFDTERMYLECCTPVVRQLGYEGMDEVAYACIGLTQEETERTLREYFGADFPMDEFNRMSFQVFQKRYNESGLPIKDGVVDLLEYLRDCGARTAIGSSTRTETVRMELRDMGLIDYFDVIVGGDMASRSKPEPDVFLRAAGELGLPVEAERIAAECFIIEDSFNGVRAANKAGATVIMVPDMLQPTDEICALTDFVFDSLHDVRRHFGG